MSGAVTTAVPDCVFGPTGFTLPTEAAVLAGANLDINAAFGGALNQGTSTGGVTNPTPQGVLAASMAAIIGDKNSTFVFYTQQTDPAFASGRMQDGIARIYFITRNPALPTVVTATCTGLPNVQIPVGARAVATDGTIYLCTSGGTIPASGSIDLQFAASTTGPIACPAESLSVIYQAIPGWDTISNADDGVVGNVVESRAAFENRRGQSVALNSVGSLGAVLAAVLNVPNVLDAYCTENDTNAAATIGGVSIGANALYVAVSGGAAQAVAQAIWTKKMPGCPYYAGNTTETVLDTNSGYSTPYPSYQVTFETPAPLPIYFAVSIANSVAVPSNALALIQAAILLAFSGADGGTRQRIGATVYASRYYAGVAGLGAWASVISILIGTASPAGANTVPVNINQVPVCAAADIAVTLV